MGAAYHDDDNSRPGAQHYHSKGSTKLLPLIHVGEPQPCSVIG